MARSCEECSLNGNCTWQPEVTRNREEAKFLLDYAEKKQKRKEFRKLRKVFIKADIYILITHIKDWIRGGVKNDA